ncbi:CCT-theta [Aphelenchoides besseyi]|nr:CCT-theta [Aphelenchoides besseyi]KAI6212202.1 CCT-theta [Aphelenchoides besseyi]
MAMQIPKSGYSRFMKEGAQSFKGLDEAVMRNIEACVELAGQIRSAYGPNGMNKMVINHIEKMFVTNDAATILNELEVQHPAARMIVMATQQQEAQIGDNTNTVLIFAAALLEHAAELIKMGLKPVEISAGYTLAYEKAAEILPELVAATFTELTDLEKTRKVLKSSIMSKQYDQYELVADLVAKACVQTVPRNASAFNVDNIRVVKILGAGVGSSHVMNGMVFRRGAEGDVKKITNARVAVFACPFDLTQTETKGTVLMNNAEDLLEFSKTEESEVENQVKALHEAGVNVVVAAGKFGDIYLHYLNKYKIMGVRLVSKFDMRRLCRTIGAQAQARVIAPSVDALGQCNEVYTKEIGGDHVVVFDRTTDVARVATIIIRGSSQSLMDDVERAVDDAVNTYKALTKDGRLLAGAGAVEIELARRIESIGEKFEGLEQYSVKKFANALDTLPKLLAENAGLKPNEILSSLRAVHQKGEQHQGLDVVSGTIMNAVENNVFDIFAAKKLALKLATNAAATVLLIDQIIMAKPAGGPPVRGPKPQDEDDGMA